MGSFDTRDHYSAKVGVIGIRDPRWTIVLNGIMSTLKRANDDLQQGIRVGDDLHYDTSSDPDLYTY